MAVLPIIKIGHPTLRKVAAPIREFNKELRELAQNMIETMRLNDGIGLAAPQVNISRRMFVIDKHLIQEDWEAEAYINPEILESEGAEAFEEGCLSIPGIREEVVRPTKIRVRYQKLDGSQVEEMMDGLLARVFQHEFDHLEGILFTDKISPIKKKLLESRLRELEETYAVR